MNNPAYQTERWIRFADVDAVGWLYYPRFFEVCHKAFEDWVNLKGPINYPEMIHNRKFGFPAVKASGEYLAPLAHGDTVIIKLKPTKIGKSSLKTEFEFYRKLDNKLSFKAEIITVCTSMTTRKSMPIPDDMREFLNG